MKLFNLKHFFLVCACLPLFSLQAKKTESPKDILNQHISFKENRGQVSDQNYKPRPDILFSGTTGNLNFHLKKDGVSYQLSRVEYWREEEDFKTKEKRKYADQYTIYRVDMNWLNVNSSPLIKKEGQSADYENYYLPTCPNGALGVKSYSQITYQQLYNGIDLKWYEKNGNLKYDYIVAKGADYRQIQIEIKGATDISLNAGGALEIITPLGTLVEEAPTAIQNGKTLRTTWKIKDNKLSFEIDNVDPALPFVIDPVVRVWGTYFGPLCVGTTCAVTTNGDVCMTGHLGSDTPNIATSGAHQSVFGGALEAFLVKFNTAGTRLWCTYYGGSNIDKATDCAVDSTGNIYMLGITNSFTDAVIATPGSHQVSSGNPGTSKNDAFVVKFNSAGVRIWGTYYGGTNEEFGSGIAYQSGNIFIVGKTNSSNGTSIATTGSHQQIFAGGGAPASPNFDGFLAKFNTSGTRQWGTYYGGTGQEEVNSCVVDLSGNVVISGGTSSGGNTVIATPGSYQSVFNSSGQGDVFLAKFNSSGMRQWGTYYGGAGNDACYASSIDKSGNIFLSGATTSSTGIATAGAFQSSPVTGADGFLSKFSSAGLLQWGTYYTANYGVFCETDIAGDVFVGGFSSSQPSISTTGSHQLTFGGGTYDGFITKFNTTGSRQWGSYYGGNADDFGYGCSIDLTGNVFMCGYSWSTNDTAISTPGCYQGSLLLDLMGSTTYNAFLVKLRDTETNVVGLSENKANNGPEILIFPNPTKDNLNLIMSEKNLENGIFKLRITNCLGQVCKEIVQNMEGSQITINLSDLPNGMYTLTVTGNNSTTTAKKFIITR